MVFPIAGGNESKGYEVSNSIRLDDGSNSFLSKSFGSDGNRRTFTFSCWTKGQADSSAYHSLFTSGNDNPDTSIWFNPDEALRTNTYNSGSIHDVITNRVFRDPSAWYHIVVAYDTTQSTASNRVKIYVNGVQETSFSTSSYPDQNYETFINDASYTHRVGSHTSSAYAGDGYLCEVAFIDGTQYAASNFGEFDDNGVWIPKDFKNDVTFGSNGFYLEFKQTGTSANSSGIGADTSGQDNHFGVTSLAATDVTEDTCTNNFATLNPLKTTSTSANLSEGNTKFSITANSAGSERNAFATITFPNSGKWYMETKVTHSALSSDSGNQAYVGVLENPDNIDHLTTSNPNSISTNGIFTDVRLVGTLSDAIQHGTNGSATSYNTDPDWSSGDIIGIALDMDNGKIYYHLNGTYYDDASGNVPNPATPANHNHSFTVPSNGLAFFVSVLRYNTSTIAIETNFGNPSYSISSGNNDGKYGNFEYAVPSGYYALCTKRLAEFG